jgi:DNA (cytosine-5)-methyltransferase 1
LDSASANRIREKLSLTKTQWLRRLVPEELELLNMFPVGHSEGQPDGRRAFFMGNALVIGIIERFAKEMCKD